MIIALFCEWQFYTGYKSIYKLADMQAVESSGLHTVIVRMGLGTLMENTKNMP